MNDLIKIIYLLRLKVEPKKLSTKLLLAWDEKYLSNSKEIIQALGANKNNV